MVLLIKTALPSDATAMLKGLWEDCAPMTRALEPLDMCAEVLHCHKVPD